MNTIPIKRHPAIQAFSREHHSGLLLCWKIREGFRRDIAADRIKKYSDWFWTQHLEPHFREEETLVFTVLPATNELVRKALFQHQVLKHLFEQPEDPVLSLHHIADELEAHIRFEERVLFREIQDAASAVHFQDMGTHRQIPDNDTWPDEFWK